MLTDLTPSVGAITNAGGGNYFGYGSNTLAHGEPFIGPIDLPAILNGERTTHHAA